MHTHTHTHTGKEKEKQADGEPSGKNHNSSGIASSSFFVPSFILRRTIALSEIEQVFSVTIDMI